MLNPKPRVELTMLLDFGKWVIQQMEWRLLSELTMFWYCTDCFCHPNFNLSYLIRKASQTHLFTLTKILIQSSLPNPFSQLHNLFLPNSFYLILGLPAYTLYWTYREQVFIYTNSRNQWFRNSRVFHHLRAAKIVSCSVPHKIKHYKLCLMDVIALIYTHHMLPCMPSP